VGGATCAVHFTDDATRFTKVYMMKHKSDVVDCFQKYLTYCSSHGVKVKMLKSDWEKVYISKKMVALCAANQILQQHSAPYCHESNGRAERIWRTLGEMTRVMLLTAILPAPYWSFAMQHACYLRNRLPHSALGGSKTPYEAWFKRKPDLSNLKVWGCKVYAFIDVNTRAKMENSAKSAIFVGIAEEQNAFLLFDPIKATVFRSGMISNWVEGLNDRCQLTHPYMQTPELPSDFDPDCEQEINVADPSGTQLPSMEDTDAILVPDETEFKLAPFLEILGPINILQVDVMTSSNLKTAVVKLTSANVAVPFWTSYSTLCGINGSSSGSRTNHYQKLSAFLKTDSKTTTLLGSRSNYIEKSVRQGRGTKPKRTIPCLIGEMNTSDEKGDFFKALFYDASHKLISTTDIDISNVVDSVINATFNSMNWKFDPDRFRKFHVLSDVGPFDIDACCEPDGTNSQLEGRFWSDALNKSWLGLNVWVNPPFHLIYMFLIHFLHQQSIDPANTRAVFILPLWDTQSWWSLTQYFDVVETFPVGTLLFTGPAYDTPIASKWPVVVLRWKMPEVEHKILNIVKNRSAGTAVKSNKTTSSLPPRTLKEARTRSDASLWEEATDKELSTLDKKNLAIVVTWPRHKRVIKSRLIYKIKYNKDRSINKYKARFVACGYDQEYGVDYFETYAPVAQLTSIRLMLALILNMVLTPFHLDVEAAFINADLTEEIYVQMPEGKKQYDPDGNELCWLLKKSLYGLKQAPRDWNILIEKWLTDYGFVQSEKEPCIFTYTKDSIYCLLCLYVDDMPGGHNNAEWFAKFKTDLGNRFTIEDLGSLTYILGIEVDHSTNKIEMSQSKYIAEAIERFGLTQSNAKDVPIDPNFIISAFDSPTSETDKMKMKQIPYLQIIGVLLWISRVSRPDISYAVGVLSRYSSNPSMRHYYAALGVLKYLKGTINNKLVYEKDTSADTLTTYSISSRKKNFLSYSDSDWAGDCDDRKSTSGFLVFYKGCLLAWNSSKQPITSLSSTEAEYIGLGHSAKEVSYFIELLSTLGLTVTSTLKSVFNTDATILGDNQSSLFLAYHPKTSTKTKHISLRFHFIREMTKNHVFDLEFCPTAKMLADIMTKALAFARHKDLSSKIMDFHRYMKQ